MSKYRFNISDYHAIENADILVDGITVLAGPNGSGKVPFPNGCIIWWMLPLDSMSM